MDLKHLNAHKYSLTKISSLDSVVTYSYDFGNFSLNILIKCILCIKKKKQNSNNRERLIFGCN